MRAHFKLKWLLGGLALIAGGGELGLRAVGAADFPLFHADPAIGYFPQPNQQGAYLRSHHWVFNDRSMGTERQFTASPDAVLLVGDSIVYGGNPLNQPDKLGPTLERISRRPIYPLSAGGWAFANELAMLRANPDLLTTPTIVVVANSGDYGQIAPWTSAINWPTGHPLSAIDYNMRKFLFKPQDVVFSAQSAEASRRWQTDLAWLLAQYHGRLIWVLYPTLAEVHRPLPANFGPVLQQLQGRAEIVDVFGAAEWTTKLYRDGVIHPSAAGDKVLAGIIAAQLAKPPLARQTEWVTPVHAFAAPS
jgi:hypothetical protein